ncbi:MAG: toxin-antitoxin system protein, partial [bacterium]
MPHSSTVRISKKAKETLQELSSKSGATMLYVLDRAIENYRRRAFLEEVNRAYGRLRADEKASKEFDSEIAAWDTTLMDVL